MIKIHNLVLFIACALWRGIPFHLWPHAWRGVQEAHRQEVHKAVWELKKQGRVRQDREGRLWSVRKK